MEINKERKTIANFCYVIRGQRSVPLNDWLRDNGYTASDCGLVRIDHGRDLYAVFHQSQSKIPFHGIYSSEESDDVSLSAIPQGPEPIGILSFNKDGYSLYCKEYRQYWQWVEERNDARYENTISHGKNYDTKNMMHVFRLLNMARRDSTLQKNYGEKIRA
jgi:hypothetical protein